MENKLAVLSLSGGLDSSTLLLHLLEQGYQVTALSFLYGQKHKIELDRAKKLVKYLQKKGLTVKHQIIDLKGLGELLESSLTTEGYETPEGHYDQDTMKDTVVPNRNKIFSSIIQGVALSISKQYNEEVIISLGIHKGDHLIYPDTSEEFRDADYKAFLVGNWGAERVTYYTPYIDIDKSEVLEDGKEVCKKLALSFNQVYKNTSTSYKPIKVGNKWYSDIYSGSSVERIEAFIKLKKKDPIQYAENDGTVVSWEYVKEKVNKIIEDFKNS